MARVLSGPSREIRTLSVRVRSIALRVCNFRDAQVRGSQGSGVRGSETTVRLYLKKKKKASLGYIVNSRTAWATE